MPDFYFKIRSATQNTATGTPVRLPDSPAAREEATGIFVDFARNIAADLAEVPVWRLEVLDNDGKVIFRIKVVAETP